MISIIIVNFNQKRFLKLCLGSIYENFRSYPFEVIVVNNSPAEDLKDLQSEFGFKLLQNENKGYSQANNLGASHSSGEYLFFLNADTLIRSDFLYDFAERFSGKDFGAAGMKLYNEDGTFQLSFWKENTFFNEIKNKKDEKRFRERDKDYMSDKEREYREIKEVDWVTGAAMIIRKDVFNKIRGFDEKYFLFYEDADICKTLSDSGYKNYFYPFSNIMHYKGENVNSDFSDNTYYFSKESQLIYYKKNNGLLDNLLIRIYLFMKFSLLYLTSFRKIYLRILKLTLGIKSR